MEIKCTQCGGKAPIEEDADFIRCPFCETALYIDADRSVKHFYMDPAVADSAGEIIDGMIAGDSRFFFYDPSRPDRDYNYNANEVLVNAIEKGYRGAYWDILRQVAEGASE